MTTPSPSAASGRSADLRLARVGLEPLVAELARRFEEGPGPPVRLHLKGLDHRQQSAIADLFGAERLPGATTVVTVGQLCLRLGLADVGELRDCVARLRGGLVDRRAQRQERRETAEELWSWFRHRSADIVLPGLGPLSGWPEAVQREGVRGTATEHRKVLEDAVRALEALPRDGTPLAVFAMEVADDPHALDRGRRLSRLVTDAVADAGRLPQARTAEGIRELWEAVGVEPDPLSSTVLVLGLRAAADHPLAPYLAQHTDRSEPVSLTLSQLRRWPLAPLSPSTPVFVVENPSLIASAARRGWSGPPLVCSSGRPTMAVVHLVRQLGAGGARVLQHADFDGSGLGISTWLVEWAGTIPWLMTAEAYREQLRRPTARPELAGPVPDSPWDPALSREMRRCRLAAFEEEVVEELLAAMASEGV